MPKPVRNETERFGTAKASLSPKQEAVALALARGVSIQDAATKNDVGVTTAKRWLVEVPALRERVRELRSGMTDSALGVLTDGVTFAAHTIRKLLTAKSEMVRLNAARTLIELKNKLFETVELEQRIAALEGR